MLEVKDLHKFYGSFHAVRGITFDVKAGEIVGFLGPNGAGKTTTMKIITGFMSMTSGSISVDGHDVTEDSMAVRRTIGYLPENAPLYEDLTVREYLAFICDVRGLHGARRRDRLDYVIDVCSLARKHRAVIKTLSKGYRQRVGLAQAIIHEPKLVILDEPTVGLDPNQIFEARDLIRQIGRDNTVILSSHILSEVEAICSRVVIINDGRIAASGTPTELESRLGSDGRHLVALRGSGDAAIASVRALNSVAEIAVVNRIEPVCELVVLARDSETFVREINQLCAIRGWLIESLQADQPKLEDVFRSLTSPRNAMSSAAMAVETTSAHVPVGISEGEKKS